MIGPESTPLQLVLEAQTDPALVLQVCMGRLVAARDIVRMDFDDFNAARHLRETAAVLVAVADSLKAHSLSGGKRQTKRQRMVKEAQHRPAEDADAKGSPMWQALDAPDETEAEK